MAISWDFESVVTFALFYVAIFAKPCPEGEFSHGEGCIKQCPLAYWNQTCVEECPAGFYADQEVSSHRECKGCVEGTYAANNGSTYCTPCASGFYQDQKQSVRCKKCPKGSRSAGPAHSKICTQCDPGSYQNEEGQGECKPCAEGTYQDESGAVSCKKCEINTYQDNEGQAGCDECPDEKDESKVPLQCAWKECPMGYKKQQSADQGHTECVICPHGTYQPDEDGTTCLPCPRGYYSNRRGSIRCIKCPENAWTHAKGRGSFFDCIGPSIQLFEEEEHQDKFVIVYGPSPPPANPNNLKLEFRFARVLSGKWRLKKDNVWHQEGGLLKTDQIFTLVDIEPKINNEFCYFPLDLSSFEGRINKTENGEYCAPWTKGSGDNYCTTKRTNQGHARPGSEPWCLDGTTGNPVSCGIPVCGWDTLCKSSARGTEYRGSLSGTNLGYDCMQWTSNFPHPNKDYDHDHKAEHGIGDHRYCRNPSETYPNVFCYTTNWLKRYDDCNVRRCTEEHHPRYIFKDDLKKRKRAARLQTY